MLGSDFLFRLSMRQGPGAVISTCADVFANLAVLIMLARSNRMPALEALFSSPLTKRRATGSQSRWGGSK